MYNKSKSFSLSPRVVSIGRLLLCILGAVIVGHLSVWLSGGWQGYDSINVSAMTPPPYLMGIVWSVLFALLGASLYIVTNESAFTLRAKQLKNISITLWCVQYIILLSIPFFLFSHNIFMLSFIACSFILAITSALALINLKINPLASLALIPFLAWMIFETYLSIIILINNF